ncbi:MAG TPA: LCP family protein [Acidimicrobiales bacterium]|nr:LCP family protein [Acidimicrobiales bacterium]
MLVGANIVVAICILSGAAVYGYVRLKIDSIRTLAAPHLSKTLNGAIDSSGGLTPENILLIGNQSRADISSSEIQAFGSPQSLSGSLSDVIMILHVDPAKNSASLLSIPRDLFVPMPPGSPVGPYQKIDAALNDGKKGPDNLIQAITTDFGIPINHFVELQFDGFQGTVNALGGINVYFPEPLYDKQSGLWVASPGCTHLSGAAALALVRARHLQYDPPGDNAPRSSWPYDPESDLSRIVRDHTFLRILATTAKSQGLTNPITLNSFLGAVINQITVDPALKAQLISVASHYRHINPDSIPELTLPVTTVGGATGYYYGGANIGDVDFPVQPADNQVIAQWDSSALPAPQPPTQVNVFNLAGGYNLASKTSGALRADGVAAVTAGDKPVPASITETFVDYPAEAGGLAQAIYVSNLLSGSVMLRQQPNLPAGTIDVEAGSLLAVVPPASAVAAPPGTGAPPSTAPGMTVATNQSRSGAGTSLAAPTPGGQKPSSASDQNQPWDPSACPAKPAASR